MSQDALLESIAAYRQALQTMRAGHPNRAVLYANLSTALIALYERTGEIHTLKDAVDAARQATDSAGTARVNRVVYLSSLAAALQIMYERDGQRETLTDCVTVRRMAVQETDANQPARARCLSNLACGLEILSRRDHDEDKLYEAVIHARDAARIGNPTDASWPGIQSNLGVVLRRLAEHTADPAPLAEAIEAGRVAVAGTHPGHPDEVGALINLGNTLAAAFRLAADRHAHAEASAMLGRAASLSSAPAGLRIDAARAQANCEMLVGNYPMALAVLDRAVRLIPFAAPRYLIRADREYALANATGLATEAAAAALAAGQAEQAVELLEQARCVLHAKELHSNEATQQGPAAHHNWPEPKQLAELLPAAARGPIVIVNVGRWRCDALVVTATGVQPMTLAGLTAEAVAEQARNYLSAMQRADQAARALHLTSHGREPVRSSATIARAGAEASLQALQRN
jgi:tetratricopeptide (TPR) repeat protein